MRILICSGIYPPDVGGPAKYAKNLYQYWKDHDQWVKILYYNKIEKFLPSGLRHIWFFLRILFSLKKIDIILALDNFSVGLPAVLIGKLFNKKVVIRVGGDFLWESYLEKTGDLITLVDFYKKPRIFPFKQRIIFWLTKFIFNNSTLLAFNSKWLQNIFGEVYSLNRNKSVVVENFYGLKKSSTNVEEFDVRKKVFLWAGRMINMKNLEKLKKSFALARIKDSSLQLELVTGVSHFDLEAKIKNSYSVILPSLTDVAPNFIIEAMRHNIPFILTRENGLPDHFKNFGLLVDPMDIEDIADKILFLAKSENYKIIKSKIISLTWERTWKDVADDFLETFKNL